jgi:hypothetical protein
VKKVKIVDEKFLEALCIASLDTISDVVLDSPLSANKRWKTIYRKMQRLECDISNGAVK